MKTRSQEIEDLRTELAAYVGFLARRGTPMSFQSVLLNHREQCQLNFRDDPETFRERLSLLDAVCQEEGVA